MSAGNQLEMPCPSAGQFGWRHSLAALRCVLLAATVCHTAVIRADLIDVVNPSFEDVSGGFVFNEFTFGAPPGWQIYDPHAVLLNGGVGPQFWVGTLAPNPPTFFSGPAPHGQRVAIAFNVFGTGNLGEYGLQQTLEATLLANYLYTLQVEIGNIASGTAVNGEFYDLDGFPGYRIDLLAGGVVIASDDNTLAGTIAEGAWGTSTVVFQTDESHPLLGQPLAIRLVSLNQIDAAFPGADLEVDFDLVRLTGVAVPEPSPLASAGLVAWLLAGLSRRGRQATRQTTPAMIAGIS